MPYVGVKPAEITSSTEAQIDNIKIDGNTVSSTDTNGNIAVTPDGTGSVVIDGLSHPQSDGSAGQFLKTDGSGNLSFGSVTTSGAYDLNGGELTLDADGDTTIHADTDDRIDFKTAGTDRMHIDSSGNVGIGTSSPDSELHIASTSTPTISIEDTDNGFSASTIVVQNGGRDLAVTTPQDTIFVQGSSESMRILDGGNVGIGTSSPAAKLEVEGTILGSETISIQDTGNNSIVTINTNNDTDCRLDFNASRTTASNISHRFASYNSGTVYMDLNPNGRARLRSEGGGGVRVDLQQGSAKHWVNIDIEGTNSTPDSYNHSSFADNGTGKVTININNDMNNASYAVSNASSRASDGTAYVAAGFIGSTFSTSQIQIYFAYANASFGAFHDVPRSGTKLHGDLA